jgi:menaquinone-9 beta-reductase
MPAADVLVVGAGPAGSVAALVLARAGLTVRLIDRARFPRHKLCGDTLNPGALALLASLCAPDSNDVYSNVLHRAVPIRGMTVTGPGRARVTADYPYGLRGAAITRQELDLFLLNAATRAGASFEPGTSAIAPLLADDGARVVGATVKTGGRRHGLRAGVVIAADGRGSRMASALQLSRLARKPQRWAYGAYFTDVEGMTLHGEMHLRADGYVGVAPLPDGITNVCVVRERRHLRAHDVAAAQIVSGALNSDPGLKDRFAVARQMSHVVALGPLAVDAPAAGYPGLLLAGDAAGFIDPMTGDGLRFALRGGVLAAEAAQAELSTGQPASARLAQTRAREFTSKLRLNRALRSLVGSPLALEMVSLLATIWARPVEHLIGVAGDVGLARR